MENSELIPNEEYETQFFGFPPTDLLIGLEGLVKDHFKHALECLATQMRKIPSNILSEEELQKGIDELSKLTDDHLEKALLKLRSHLLKNVLNIPPNILLPEDTEQAFQHTDEDVKTLLTEIQELKNELKYEKYVTAKLEEELIDVDKVLTSQKALLETYFNPAMQGFLDEAKERLQFLATNSDEMVKLFESFKEESNQLECETEMGELFETYALK